MSHPATRPNSTRASAGISTPYETARACVLSWPGGGARPGARPRDRTSRGRAGRRSAGSSAARRRPRRARSARPRSRRRRAAAPGSACGRASGRARPRTRGRRSSNKAQREAWSAPPVHPFQRRAGPPCSTLNTVMGGRMFRISRYEGGGATDVPRGRLAGGDVQGDEGALALAEHGELADHAPRDDVEVVVAVVLALVREVVIADHDDVLLGLFPEDAAGELAQAVALEVLGDRRAGVRGDVLPLDSHERPAREHLVQRFPFHRATERCPLVGTARDLLGLTAYRKRI